MGKIRCNLTVYFEEPFWVGVFEVIENRKISAARVVFGAEPKDYELLEYILRYYTGLHFSPAVDTVVKETAKNPKRFPFCKCLVDIVLTGRILGNKVEDTEEEYIMNKLFADIRHGDFDAVKSAISKNPEVVNEMFSGSKPKKDIGQSPLQVALKCAQFDIIDLLLDNGADPNKHRYDPRSESNNWPSLGMLAGSANNTLNQTKMRIDRDPEAYVVAKRNIIKILDLLIQYGADVDDWLDNGRWGSETNRQAYLDASELQEDSDYNHEIRMVFQEYFRDR